MGVSIDTGGGGGKRPLDAELNLVPFIDLLVCCICFLLITAVWSKMARIDVSQSTPSSSAKKDEVDKPKVKVTVLIDEDGYTITAGPSRNTIDKNGDAYDTEALGKKLRELKSTLPQEKKDLTVAVVDGVPYKHIIEAMDTALAASFEKIKLTDSAAAM